MPPPSDMRAVPLMRIVPAVASTSLRHAFRLSEAVLSKLITPEADSPFPLHDRMLWAPFTHSRETF